MTQLIPQIKVGKEAQAEMLAGLDVIAKAIGSTGGPGGNPFAFDKLTAEGTAVPTFSKDGLTVLRSLAFANPAYNAVLQYCKQAAAHSVLASGDGTTSTILIANAVAKLIANSNSKYPQAFARRVEKEISACIDAIKQEAILEDEAVRKVAITSSNGDEELADVTLEAIRQSSAFGTLLAVKKPSSKVRYNIIKQDGYSNCKGYDYDNTLAWTASPNAASNTPITWHNPKVLIFNGNLISAKEQFDHLLKLWNSTLETPSQLVIFAYEVSSEVSGKIMGINRHLASTGSAIFVVKPRFTAEHNSQLQIMRDIASYTGIKDEHIVDGGNLKSLSLDFFGTCDKVVIAPTNTYISGRAKNHWVVERIFQNKQIIDSARVQADAQLTSIRNAELAEGLVTVEIGGGMMPDLQERADRFDDASKAAQACMASGALPGCGVSYIRAGELAGVGDYLRGALSVIHETILANYGTDLENLSFAAGDTIKITEDGLVRGNCLDLGVMDSCATVCAVLRNGCDLGLKIATLGGYALRAMHLESDEL